MNLLESFQNYIAGNDLAAKDDRILLTVSGGVDSMVMLSLFIRSGYEVGVAHCNFQLRGAESDEDEVLVRTEAERCGVAFYNRRFETAAEMQRTGESMEMAARRLRYAWFDELSRAEGYASIAIAHHADDSIETFFINLLRGTGLRGLTGISTQIGRIIRPLMFASRKEILEYAVANRIPFREDSSNRSTKYLRNKIRLGLIPRIREINPKFTDLMRRNIARLTDAQLFINHGIERIRTEAVTSQGGIDTIRLDRIDPAFPQGFVIYELLSSAYGFKGDVIDALCHALDHDATGRRFYARDRVATVDRGTIVVSPIAPDDACSIPVERGTLRSYCGNSVLYYEYRDIDAIQNYGVPENVAQVDADRLEFPLTLRRWQEGDSFVPFGMTGRKKVSDFLIDAKVSQPEKERQFVLLSGGEIVWLVGRRIDDRFRLTPQTENVLRITKEIV
ncbi:tRNA lysidine(34) synthetase TilS [Alistipes sp.]|uniref:tRNA lysidine(34) synthetase TilS n=1 Tax=Alistipes sp. TaxID=1872444 RepID=UPI003AF14556